jgi:hypothetical protein
MYSVALTITLLPDAVSNISTIIFCRELHEMGFHGQAAANKPNITIRNAKRQLEWYFGAVETRSLE